MFFFLLLFYIFISRHSLCKVSVNFLQVEMIGLVKRDESIMDIKCFKLVLMRLLSRQPPSHIVILMVKVLFFVGD